jgi:hypothetical protein
VTATDFENVFAPRLHLRRDVMIELDASAMRFVRRLQRDVQWRIFFVRIIEKKNFLAVETPREKRIPQPPDGFANPTDGEQVINNRHASHLREAFE